MIQHVISLQDVVNCAPLTDRGALGRGSGSTSSWTGALLCVLTVVQAQCSSLRSTSPHPFLPSHRLFPPPHHSFPRFSCGRHIPTPQKSQLKCPLPLETSLITYIKAGAHAPQPYTQLFAISAQIFHSRTITIVIILYLMVCFLFEVSLPPGGQEPCLSYIYCTPSPSQAQSLCFWWMDGQTNGQIGARREERDR